MTTYLWMDGKRSLSSCVLFELENIDFHSKYEMRENEPYDK